MRSTDTPHTGVEALERVTFQAPTDLIAAVKRIGKRDQRNLSAQIRYVLASHVEADAEENAA